MLLDAGADVNYTTPLRRNTAVFFAARHYKTQHRLVQMLLERGADPNIPDSGGFTALIEAAKCNAPGMARLLLDRKAERTCVQMRGLLPWSSPS